MIYVIATLMVKPGCKDQVIAAALPCLAGTRAEDGNLSYDLHADVENADKLVFVERWQSRAHLTAHFSAPHLLAYREATKDLLASRKVEIVESDKIEVL